MSRRKILAFLLVLYIAISAAGVSYYFYHKNPLTGNASRITGTVNLTIAVGNDQTPPQVTIVSPTGTVTNLSSISVYITFTDNQIIGTCWYNVTDSSNNLVGDAFRQLVCDSGRDSLSVPSNGVYTIHAFANDSVNNQNFTTIGNFTASKSTATAAEETTASSPARGHQAFRIQSDSLEISYMAGDEGESTFSILNSMDTDADFTAYLTGLDGVLELSETSFTIPARKEHKLKLLYTGNEPGEYTGELVIASNNLVKKVSIAVSVSDSINDIGLVLDYPSIYNEVCIGCEIGFSINLESSEKTVKAVYTIKDFEGNAAYRKNEVISVKDLPYYKVIRLPNDIKEGSYVLFVAVNSGGKTQVASHLFNVVKTELREEKPSITSNVLIALLLFVLIIVNLIVMRKTK